MKIIFTLLAFSLCLTCVLSFHVTSSENNEGKPNYYYNYYKGLPLKGFAKFCYKLQYDERSDKLSAICRMNNNTKQEKTSISLKNCVGNDNGQLKKGRDFQKSSSGCFIRGKTWLACVKDNRGNQNLSKVDLNDFIGFVDGFMRC